MAFHVGQKVVCVDGRRMHPNSGNGGLAQNEIYTIRWVGLWKHPLNEREELHVRLMEIVRPCADDKGSHDTPYRAVRFRPVVSKSTKAGMAILQEILDRETVSDKPPVRQPAKTQ